MVLTEVKKGRNKKNIEEKWRKRSRNKMKYDEISLFTLAIELFDTHVRRGVARLGQRRR